MPAIHVGPLGEFLRQQRKSAQLSLRQLAEQAGVSNPYLSQIERGLRKPSAEILQQIAKGLRISAEQLYVQAGILDERTETDLAVESALLADPALTERQKRMLLDIYRSFRAENLHAEAVAAAVAVEAAAEAMTAAEGGAAADLSAGADLDAGSERAAQDETAAPESAAATAAPPAPAGRAVRPSASTGGGRAASKAAQKRPTGRAKPAPKTSTTDEGEH